MPTAMSLNHVHTQAEVALDADQSPENRKFAADQLINALHSLPGETAMRSVLTIASNNEES